MKKNMDTTDNNEYEPLSHAPSKKKIRGIALDLAKYDFPDGVKNKACEIFFRLDVGNPRNKQRTKMICYCVHQAMIELKLCNIDPKNLGTKFGLSKQETNSAIASNPCYKAGFTHNNSTTNPSDILRMYASQSFMFEDQIVEDMVQSFDQLIIKSESLLTKQARTLIAAFMWHYMSCNGYMIDQNDFAEVFGLQFTTIRLHQKDIVDADIDDL